ncbi:MAG: fabG3 [Modestobacter sp.]|jgi:hypothetical protein|nr:fabG3 [Modestobacter sp.]MCW2675636.1 fabG3 [Modestobacter sp.]
MRRRGWDRIQYIAGDSAVAIPAEMIHYAMSRTALPASPLASATTGGALRVDGGYVDSIVP